MLHLPTRTAPHDVFAAAVSQATAHHLWTGTKVSAAVHHIHLRVPEPGPVHPRREAAYLETARMSREMDHL
jgi:hypothetical protein